MSKTTLTSYFNKNIKSDGGMVSNKGRIDLLGQVQKVHYVDDRTNQSKQFVEYDVNIRDANGGSSTYSNVRLANSLVSGLNDFDETVLEENSYSAQGKLGPSNNFKNQNGALVIISFIDGQLDKPYITGIVPHPKHSGAKRSEGVRKKGEFRGLEWEVNKLGEFTLTYNGDKLSNGKSSRAETSGTSIKIDSTGALTVSDNEGQTVKVDRVSKTIVASTQGASVTLGGEVGEVDIKDAGGARVSLASGNILVTDTSGSSIVMAGGSTTVTDSAGASLQLDNGKVGLGASGIELLQTISDQLAELITWAQLAANHTHIGNLGSPTGPPDVTAAYVALATNLTTIQADIDSIKV